jgi:hypothetical protein
MRAPCSDRRSNPTAPNHPTVPFLHPLPVSAPLQHSGPAIRQRSTITTGLLSVPEKVVAVCAVHRLPVDDERESGRTG